MYSPNNSVLRAPRANIQPNSWGVRIIISGLGTSMLIYTNHEKNDPPTLVLMMANWIYQHRACTWIKGKIINRRISYLSSLIIVFWAWNWGNLMRGVCSISLSAYAGEMRPSVGFIHEITYLTMGSTWISLCGLTLSIFQKGSHLGFIHCFI